MLNIVKASKKVGVRQILTDVSLRIKEGEWLTLVGASGSGKSTLLNCIASLDTLDSGNIVINGQAQLKHRCEDVAYLMQDFPLYPSVTVGHNYDIAIRKSGLIKDGPSLDDVEETLGIQGLRKRLPYSLSGGERQRVALARTIMLKRRLILLDEPLSNVDTFLRRTIRRYLRELHERYGYTTILVTHDQEDAIANSDVIGFMHEGKILRYGDPLDVYRNPEYRVVGENFGDDEIIEVPRSLLHNELCGSWGDGACDDILLVRESQIRVEVSDGDGSLEAVVSKIEFLGTRRRVFLFIDGRTIQFFDYRYMKEFAPQLRVFVKIFITNICPMK